MTSHFGLQVSSHSWMGGWIDEWYRPKDINSALRELWFFYLPFIPSFIHSVSFSQVFVSAQLLCWILSCRHERCPVFQVPHHETFWMAAKKLRFYIYKIYYWSSYINPGLGYKLAIPFSLWAWSLISLNGLIVSLSYFVSHSRAFLEVSRVQIRNQ